MRFIPKSEQIKEKFIKPKTTKADSLPRKQNINNSQNNKKFLKNVTASGFRILEWIMNFYFQLKSTQTRWFNKQKLVLKRLWNSKWISKCKHFHFHHQKKLSEEGKLLLAVTFFEATNSIFNITDENNSFSITIPGHWETKSAEKTTDEPNKLL